MGTPYNESRDGNVPAGNSFGEQPDVPNVNPGALAAGLKPVSDRLGEEDYRSPDHRP